MSHVSPKPEGGNLCDHLTSSDKEDARALQARFQQLEKKKPVKVVTVKDIDRLISDTHVFYAKKRSR